MLSSSPILAILLVLPTVLSQQVTGDVLGNAYDHVKNEYITGSTRWMEIGFFNILPDVWTTINPSYTNWTDPVVFLSLPNLAGNTATEGTSMSLRVNNTRLLYISHDIKNFTFDAKSLNANDSYCTKWKDFYTPATLRLTPSFIGWMVVEKGKFNVSHKGFIINTDRINRTNVNESTDVRNQFKSFAQSRICDFGRNCRFNIADDDVETLLTIGQLQTTRFDRFLLLRSKVRGKRFVVYVLLPHDSLDPTNYLIPSPGEDYAWMLFQAGLKVTCVENLVIQTYKRQINYIRSDLDYGITFLQPPAVFGMVQTLLGRDSLGLRAFNIETTGSSFITQEDKCTDSETQHTTLEDAAILVVGRTTSGFTICGASYTADLRPSASPTNAPTEEPTLSPTAEPTVSPTMSPTMPPTRQPTAAPTSTPTQSPTPPPTRNPTLSPTAFPTLSPTAAPSRQPTFAPTASPTNAPTSAPTATPTRSPTASPSNSPTLAPSASPSNSPTFAPSAQPTLSPTAAPSRQPTLAPTASPTNAPTSAPTATPTRSPTASPSNSPTFAPSAQPTLSPTAAPSRQPTLAPTASPTNAPTSAPSAVPSTGTPSLSPTAIPTGIPSTAAPTVSFDWCTYITLYDTFGDGWGKDVALRVWTDNSSFPEKFLYYICPNDCGGANSTINKTVERGPFDFCINKGNDAIHYEIVSFNGPIKEYWEMYWTVEHDVISSVNRSKTTYVGDHETKMTATREKVTVYDPVNYHNQSCKRCKHPPKPPPKDGPKSGPSVKTGPKPPGPGSAGDDSSNDSRNSSASESSFSSSNSSMFEMSSNSSSSSAEDDDEEHPPASRPKPHWPLPVTLFDTYGNGWFNSSSAWTNVPLYNARDQIDWFPSRRLPETLTTPEYVIETIDRLHDVRRNTICGDLLKEDCEERLPDAKYIFRVTGALSKWDMRNNSFWHFCGKHGTIMEELEFKLVKGKCFAGKRITAHEKCYGTRSASFTGMLTINGAGETLSEYDTAVLESDLAEAVSAVAPNLHGFVSIESWEMRGNSLLAMFIINVNPATYDLDGIDTKVMQTFAGKMSSAASNYVESGIFFSFLQTSLNDLPLSTEDSLSTATSIAISEIKFVSTEMKFEHTPSVAVAFISNDQVAGQSSSVLMAFDRSLILFGIILCGIVIVGYATVSAGREIQAISHRGAELLPTESQSDRYSNSIDVSDREVIPNWN